MGHYYIEGRRKKEEGRRKREEGRRKEEEGRGKREEGRRKMEDGEFIIINYGVEKFTGKTSGDSLSTSQYKLKVSTILVKGLRPLGFTK
jgi:hypothetical protein